MRHRSAALVALAAVVAALVVYPEFASGYGVRATLQVFMWIVLAGSWNLISGLTGYVSFGHVAFFGAGAYTGAILVAKAGWSWTLRSRCSASTRSCARSCRTSRG